MSGSRRHSMPEQARVVAGARHGAVRHHETNADTEARVALERATLLAQIHGGSPVEGKKPKPQYHLDKQGFMAHKEERNTQYTGARVANIQRKGPHR